MSTNTTNNNVMEWVGHKFKATLFVTISYKGNNFKRNAEETLAEYIINMQKNGLVITDTKFIKEGKSGKHDGYAFGNYYAIEGELVHEGYKHSKKDSIRFGIFHNARVDYFNCFPILQSNIKLIK